MSLQRQTVPAVIARDRDCERDRDRDRDRDRNRDHDHDHDCDLVLGAVTVVGRRAPVLPLSAVQPEQTATLVKD